MKIQQTTNRIVNGDFSAGVSGWEPINTSKVEHYCFVATPSANSNPFHKYGMTISGVNIGIGDVSARQKIMSTDLYDYPTRKMATVVTGLVAGKKLLRLVASGSPEKPVFDPEPAMGEVIHVVDPNDDYTGNFIVGTTIDEDNLLVTGIDYLPEVDNTSGYNCNYSRTPGSATITAVFYNVPSSAFAINKSFCAFGLGYGIVSHSVYDAINRTATLTVVVLDGFPVTTFRSIKEWATFATIPNLVIFFEVPLYQYLLTAVVDTTESISGANINCVIDGDGVGIIGTLVRTFIVNPNDAIKFNRHVFLFNQEVTAPLDRDLFFKIIPTTLGTVANVSLIKGDYTEAAGSEYDILDGCADISVIPKGVIVAYTGTSCPAGWQEVRGFADDDGRKSLIPVPSGVPAAQSYDEATDRTIFEFYPNVDFRVSTVPGREPQTTYSFVPGQTLVGCTAGYNIPIRDLVPEVYTWLTGNADVRKRARQVDPVLVEVINYFDRQCECAAILTNRSVFDVRTFVFGEFFKYTWGENSLYNNINLKDDGAMWDTYNHTKLSYFPSNSYPSFKLMHYYFFCVWYHYVHIPFISGLAADPYHNFFERTNFSVAREFMVAVDEALETYIAKYGVVTKLLYDESMLIDNVDTVTQNDANNNPIFKSRIFVLGNHVTLSLNYYYFVFKSGYLKNGDPSVYAIDDPHNHTYSKTTDPIRVEKIGFKDKNNTHYATVDHTHGYFESGAFIRPKGLAMLFCQKL